MRKKGFTLVEMMIVVAIIVLIAAIAIPNLLRMKVNAAEAVAQATLRTISTAFESYAAANKGNYSTDIAKLYEANPKYLNENYTQTAGYSFTCQNCNNVSAYTVTATPISLLVTGTRSFAICTGGVLKSASGATAPACP